MVCIGKDEFNKKIEKLDELVKKIGYTGFKKEAKLCEGYLDLIKKNSKMDYDIERVYYKIITIPEWPGDVDLDELKRYFNFKLNSAENKLKNDLD